MIALGSMNIPRGSKESWDEQEDSMNPFSLCIISFQTSKVFFPESKPKLQVCLPLHRSKIFGWLVSKCRTFELEVAMYQIAWITILVKSLSWMCGCDLLAVPLLQLRKDRSSPGKDSCKGFLHSRSTSFSPPPKIHSIYGHSQACGHWWGWAWSTVRG